MIRLTAAAHCIRRECGWTAGPGTMADVDRGAEKHTKATRHPTATVATPATTTGGQRP